MNLFEDIQSEKDSSDLLPVDEQVCTMFFYFSLKERDEFRELMKKALPSLANTRTERNISDGILNLLRKYVSENE